MLDKFTDLMERILTPVADFMNGNKYVVAIQKAFSTYTPIVITGSFAFMLNLMLCSTKSGLAQFAGFEWLANYANIFSTVNYAASPAWPFGSPSSLPIPSASRTARSRSSAA